MDLDVFVTEGRSPSELRRLDDGCEVGMFRESLGIVGELRDNKAEL